MAKKNTLLLCNYRCRHYEDYDVPDGIEMECHHPRVGTRKIERGMRDNFPSWCPLEDVPESEE